MLGSEGPGMGLMDVLRKAEEQSKNAARRGKELARATLNESGRRLRRKMRMNPPAAAKSAAPEPGTAAQAQVPTSTPQPATGQRRRVSESGAREREAVRKKIVSINGKDVRTEEVSTETANPDRRTA